MNPNYIGVGNKIINLDAIALIEDLSPENPEAGPSMVLLTTTNAAEIELVGDDADAFLARAEIMLQVTDTLLARLHVPAEVQQP